MPVGYAKARVAFEARAQGWLLDRPGKQMQLPEDLRAVIAKGVPCRGCGRLVYADRENGHSVEWKPQQGGHWAAGITASCSG